MISARRQSKAADCLARELIRVRLGNAMFRDFFDRKVGIRFPLARKLAAARRRHTLADGRARLAGLARTKVLRGYGRNLDMKVDAVE